MKFIVSIISACLVSILLILAIGAIFQCKHDNRIEIISFQSEHSTAMGYVKTSCDDCGHSFGYTLFRDNPPDNSYIDTIEKHIDNNTFVAGEYHTVTASVVHQDYDSAKANISCEIRDGDIVVYFWADFKEEYGSALELFEAGDEITFRGKCSDTGFHWTDCEIVTK